MSYIPAAAPKGLNPTYFVAAGTPVSKPVYIARFVAHVASIVFVSYLASQFIKNASTSNLVVGAGLGLASFFAAAVYRKRFLAKEYVFTPFAKIYLDKVAYLKRFYQIAEAVGLVAAATGLFFATRQLVRTNPAFIATAYVGVTTAAVAYCTADLAVRSYRRWIA